MIVGHGREKEMNRTMLTLTVLAVVGYLISRAYIEICVISYFPKGKYRLYEKQTGFMQRYWLTWLLKNSESRYLRSERRRIDYPAIMAVYFYVNIVLFASLIFTVGIVLLEIVGVLNMSCAEKALTAYLIGILLSFVVYFFVEAYEHREYHRKRSRRR